MTPIRKTALLIPITQVLRPDFQSYHLQNRVSSGAWCVTIDNCLVVSKSNPSSFIGNSNKHIVTDSRAKYYQVNSLGEEPTIQWVDAIYLPMEFVFNSKVGDYLEVHSDFLREHAREFWYEVPSKTSNNGVTTS